MLRNSLLLATILFATGLAGCNKMTGGGWIIDDLSGNFINFGFNAQPVGEPDGSCELPAAEPCWAAKGKLTIVDHGNVDGQPKRLKGDFTATYTGQGPFACEETANTPCTSEFVGNAILSGQSLVFRMRITDNGEGRFPGLAEGDFVEAFFTTEEGDLVYNLIGTIGGGNLQVHKR
jgi:hypothetical protein